MQRLSLSLAFALALVACSSTKVDEGFYGPKHRQYSIAVDKQGRKDGAETWWYPDGKMKYSGFNREGFREGKFTAWYPQGEIWYEGFEYRGKPESTLTYWYPNGKIKSQALFRDGIQLERKDYDEDGRPLGGPAGLAKAEPEPAGDEVQASGDNLRKTSLRMWAMRVRQTVEGYWVLPKQFEKERPYRAVAKIKVGRDGKILGVAWSEKSPSSAFNTLAQLTFKRIKRLPAFPPQIRDESLEVQYEFISLGKPSPRKRLEARDDGGDAPQPGGDARSPADRVSP
ncbi:MAG: TonB C-terminal domain-containing protein [Fibrobacteres bacterium]|nr:TonB C-terminal domain-containing protein [Fibrobacterota bacterium]